MNKIVSLLAADEDFAELLTEFVQEIPDRILAIQQALETSDASSLRRAFHQLKGACGGYGFPSLTAEAGQLEYWIDSGKPLAELQSEICSFVDNLSSASADPN
jgi:histidine phosphotransfer protein HptB